MKNHNTGVLRFTSLLMAGGLLAVGCSQKKAAVVGPGSSPSPSVAAPAICPLTGVTPAAGSVPNRPALVAKIPNDSTARGHQSGVDTADIVYEEPVEGGITRWAAVFQCQDADKVEPIRSGRGVDLAIVAQLSRPIFVHAGGFADTGSDHELSDLKAANVLDADLLSTAYAGDAHRDSVPPAPDTTNNLYFGTQAIYSRAGSAAGGAPKPVFTFSSALGASPSASASASTAVTNTVTGTVAGNTVKVPFSAAPYNVTWTWDATNGVYLRNYDSGKTVAAAKLANGTQISARNVIIQEVAVSATGPVEDSHGSKETLVTMEGTGKALVCRMGSCVQGTWSRLSGSAATQFLDAANVPIPMAPGTSWVELLPNTQVPATS